MSITKTEQDLQDLGGRLVEREVYHTASMLIHEMAKQEKYQDELMEVMIKPDTESGYEDEYIEALEHWVISSWLADQLEAKGEMILRDFYGLTIWGRTCSGQAILLDSVIQDIAKENYT